MSNIRKCPNCASQLEENTTIKFNTLDLVGTSITAAIIFGFLGLLLFSSHSVHLIAFVGGFVAFGLYHLIGYSKKTQLKCTQCGYKLESEST